MTDKALSSLQDFTAAVEAVLTKVARLQFGYSEVAAREACIALDAAAPFIGHSCADLFTDEQAAACHAIFRETRTLELELQLACREPSTVTWNSAVHHVRQWVSTVRRQAAILELRIEDLDPAASLPERSQAARRVA